MVLVLLYMYVKERARKYIEIQLGLPMAAHKFNDCCYLVGHVFLLLYVSRMLWHAQHGLHSLSFRSSSMSAQGTSLALESWG